MVTSQQQAVDLDYLTRVLKDVDIDKVEPEFASYVNFRGERVFHQCDDSHSGYEEGFCNGGLFFLTSARADLNYGGWSYACKRHLRKLAFEFALKLEEKSLDREFSEWEDELASHTCQECGATLDSSGEPHDHREVESRCSVCGGYDGEHDWEVHAAEMQMESLA